MKWLPPKNFMIHGPFVPLRSSWFTVLPKRMLRDVIEEMTATWKETTIQKSWATMRSATSTMLSLSFLTRLCLRESSIWKNKSVPEASIVKFILLGLLLRVWREGSFLFVIDKLEKPRCFKGIKKLPCRYRRQKTWINLEIFEEWVREWNGIFEKEQRKVALIVDTCPAHPMMED